MPKHIKNTPEICPNMSKICKDISRYTKYQAVAAGAGPGGAAQPPLSILYILVYLCISWIYLNIFEHIFAIFQNGIFWTPNGNTLSRTMQYKLIGRTHMMRLCASSRAMFAMPNACYFGFTSPAIDCLHNLQRGQGLHKWRRRSVAGRCGYEQSWSGKHWLMHARGSGFQSHFSMSTCVTHFPKIHQHI